MVKFGKNKFKALNRVAKKQKTATDRTTNKILKKKLNVEKKLSFQRTILLKEAASSDNSLVENVSAKKINLDELFKKEVKKKPKSEIVEGKPKVKSVERHKKRQKTQINDTKLLLSLMKKK